MALLAKMAAAKATAKPTVPVAVSEDKDSITIRILKSLSEDQIRENYHEAQGDKPEKTTYSVAVMPTQGGKPAEAFVFVVKGTNAAGESTTAKMRFSLGAFNLQFRGIEA